MLVSQLVDYQRVTQHFRKLLTMKDLRNSEFPKCLTIKDLRNKSFFKKLVDLVPFLNDSIPMLTKENERVVEHSPFNRPLRIAERIAFHSERSTFWLRCSEKAKSAFSKAKRMAIAMEHVHQAKLLEFDLNDNH